MDTDVIKEILHYFSVKLNFLECDYSSNKIMNLVSQLLFANTVWDQHFAQSHGPGLCNTNTLTWFFLTTGQHS